MGRFDDDSDDWNKSPNQVSVIEEEGLIHLYVEENPLVLTSYNPTNFITQEELPEIQLEQVVEDLSLESLDDLKEFIETCAYAVPSSGNQTGSGGGGGLFSTDITSNGGIAGSKVYAPDTVPANAVITEAVVDNDSVRIHFMAEGGSAFYSPTITVDGIVATNLQEDPSDKRHFTGYVDVVVTESRIVQFTSSTGATGSVYVIRAAAGPTINEITFGPYPGIQTELKENDQIAVTVAVDNTATEVDILGVGGAKFTSLTVGGFDSGGIGYKFATGIINISNLSGAQTVTAIARNALGTEGDQFSSTDTLLLNQTYPSISINSVDYPATQGALKTGESATVNNTANNFDTIVYSSSDLLISSPTVFEGNKTVTESNGQDYINSGNNFTISANRISNDATTVVNGLVKLAKVAPTASITIVGSPSRLTSSPSGTSYTVRLLATQELNGAPSLDASIGSWSGSWSYSSGYWRRTLVITDSDPRGTGLFSNLVITNLAGIIGNTITSGSTYEVGGFSLRTVTFPSFSQLTAIGTNVANTAKVQVNLTGGGSLDFYPNTDDHFNGFSIVDSGGTYDPNGDYLWLSDAAFAGSNVSGTLKCDIQEIE